MSYIDQFFQVLVTAGASDLHLGEGDAPKIRRHGEIVPIREEVLSHDEMAFMLSEISGPDRWARYEETGDLDFAYEMDEHSALPLQLPKADATDYGCGLSPSSPRKS